MPIWMLQFLNVFFLIFHTALVLFNVLGWMFTKTLRWNLVTLALTAASWGLMGIKYGLGYCLCTDWHWQVRQALGIHDQARTFIQLLVFQFSGWLPSEQLASSLTASFFFVSLFASVTLNIRKSRNALATKG